MVVNYSGNCNAQKFYCVLVPCTPSGKVSKQVCMRCIREQGVALRITKHCYCIFCFWSFWSFNLYIIHYGVWFDNVVAFCHLSKVKFCARIHGSFKNPRHNCFTVRNTSSKWEHLFFVPRDRQMIRLPLLRVTWSWRISKKEETGWGWQTFCGTTKGKTLTNLRTKTNNWGYLTVRGAMLSINSNRNVNFVEKKIIEVV